ncbi:ABC transporter permease [Brevibacillus brevis]|uniref:ABC transporter permease n=1 Tax=Brevibacillus brevis TaxID=1393 RepID=A0A2Z4MRB2_BREBE|nr:ABC transporter permease [Brevibacillus brevis]
MSFQHQEGGEKLKKEERNVEELHEHRDFQGEHFRCCAIFQDYFVIKNDFLNTSSKTLK